MTGEEAKRPCSESGQVLIIAILAMTVLIGFMAMSIDVGLWYHTRQTAQNAADAAALAGAGQISVDPSQAITVARTYATNNGYTNGVGGATVTVDYPYQSDATKIHVTISKPVPIEFAAVLSNFVAFNVSASAVARSAGSGQGFYALFAHGGSSSCSGNITMSGGGNTVVGAVQADGTLTTSGSSGSTPTSITGNTGYACTLNTDSNTTITPAAVKDTSLDWPVYYTTSDFLPCTFGSLTGPDITLSDGTHWNSVTDPGYVNTLKPGVYCAQNNITGTMDNRDGTVTLVTSSSSGKIDISGGSTTLQPFLSNHVLAFSSSTSGNHAVVLSGGGSQWNGIIVAEFGGVTLSGGKNAGGTAAGLTGAVMSQNVTISGGASTLQAAYLPSGQGGSIALIE
jgi:Putative Flp pilus-assembly TadE/G-like